MRQNLQWWIATVETQSNVISHGNPEITMCTDACTEISDQEADIGKLTTRGTFLPSDLTFTFGYINALELLAIKFRLLSFKELLRDKIVLVKCDNITAVAYIRNMGGTHSVICNIHTYIHTYIHTSLAFLYLYSWHFQFCGRRGIS